MAIPFNPPYFTFAGNARETIEFYAEVFGGELQLATLKDFQAPVAPEHENLVMHAELITKHGFNLRISDGATNIQPLTAAPPGAPP